MHFGQNPALCLRTLNVAQGVERVNANQATLYTIESVH